VARYTLTIRREGASDKTRFDALAEALDALEERLRAASRAQRGEAQGTIFRDFEPVEIVAVRGEIAGSGIRAGVDVRADGSTEAFTGRFRRALVAQRSGESAYDALRRVVAADGAA